MTDKKKVATFNGVARKGLSEKSGDKTLPTKLRAFRQTNHPEGERAWCVQKYRDKAV